MSKVIRRHDIPLLRTWDRLRFALRYMPAGPLARWALWGEEDSNFTYDLTPRNKQHLSAFVAAVTKATFQRAAAAIREAETDSELMAHIGKPVGRRLGWYAITRLIKPRLVIETGIDQGVGSCVLGAALLRNAAEGCPGRYVGTDIEPGAGRLFTEPYAAAGEIIYGDSLTSLRAMRPTGVELFINDSDHSAAYEREEYEFIAAALSPRALVIGDNAHATDELLQFAQSTDRCFLFFREEPQDHWYPGAGIGVAFRSPT